MANPQAHYETTGPEIWEQTGGEIDALVISVGTGGTISGAGRYLKERNPDILIVGADPEGSIYTSEETHPYLVEGIGKDTWPETMARDVVDRWAGSDRDRVQDCASPRPRGGDPRRRLWGTTIWAALELAKDVGPDARILTVLPDSGRSYLSKFFDDNWMSSTASSSGRCPRRRSTRCCASSAARSMRCRPRHDRVARQGGGRDRPDAALLDLAAAGRERAGRVARRRRRLLQERGVLDRVFKNPDA